MVDKAITFRFVFVAQSSLQNLAKVTKITQSLTMLQAQSVGQCKGGFVPEKLRISLLVNSVGLSVSYNCVRALVQFHVFRGTKKAYLNDKNITVQSQKKGCRLARDVGVIPGYPIILLARSA